MNTIPLIVPGFHGSGPTHWQSWLEDMLPESRRVTGIDWEQPILRVWADAIVRCIDNCPKPVIIVGHSFGCLASTLAVLERPKQVAGVLLVAPADPERFAAQGVRKSTDPGSGASVGALLPSRGLGTTGLVIASTNDPWMTFAKARTWAGIWELSLYNAGRVGHINVDSGHGPWPLVCELLQALQVALDESVTLPQLLRDAQHRSQNVRGALNPEAVPSSAPVWRGVEHPLWPTYSRFRNKLPTYYYF